MKNLKFTYKSRTQNGRINSGVYPIMVHAFLFQQDKVPNDF
jgi:hypothetical protein